MRRLARRLGRQDGFGLVELLIAMTVLVVGLLALVASFGSGYAAINRASTTGTASVLADKQMEAFRAMTYTAIQAQPADSGWVQQAAAPDGRTYWVRTTRQDETVTGGGTVQLVDVYVKDATREWVHEQSTFDPLTGS
jgi:prepilin-type N-terminal cleavage/methylation domain-containing protein